MEETVASQATNSTYVVVIAPAAAAAKLFAKLLLHARSKQQEGF